MLHSFKLTILSIMCFLWGESFAQKQRSFHSEPYQLDKTIQQHSSDFQFWRGLSESSHNHIVIERKTDGKRKVLYDDFIPDGLYSVVDMNMDGYKDFVTFYHDYNVTYIFDPKTNGFLSTPVYTPLQHEMLDRQHLLFWGNIDAGYGEPYATSIFYTFRGYDTYSYFQLRYITKENYDGKSAAIRIELYHFQDGQYSKPVFVKRIQTNQPDKFDARHYWRKHYRELLGYR